MKKNLYAVYKAENYLINIGTKEEMEKCAKIVASFCKDVNVVRLSKLIDKKLDIEKQIITLMNISGFGSEDYFYDEATRSLTVCIEWGDWKRDHAALDQFIETVFNVKTKDEELTASDGSDTYSSIHRYWF